MAFELNGCLMMKKQEFNEEEKEIFEESRRETS